MHPNKPTQKMLRRLKALATAAALFACLLLPAPATLLAGDKPLLLAGLKAAIIQEPESPEAEPPRSVSADNRKEEHLAIQSIARESFYDPANPDLGTLQRLDEATRNLPFDANGFPDWMRALREGAINPRASLKGQGKMEVLDKDIIMRNTKEMPNVRFPHLSHTLWLACSNCHPDPFKPVAGANTIQMADIFRGEFCGKCHDRVAFITFFSCSRCHSVPQNKASGGK